MTIEFKGWPKTPRLNRGIIITEKLDGTNSAVIVTEDGEVGAQSRNRLITPGKQTDNYGFAQWVQDNAEALREHGSLAVPGFMNPEGIMVYHTASQQVYKVLLENDELPKTAVPNA